MYYTGIVPDIREISGYSRDLSILKNFGSDFIVSNKEVRCDYLSAKAFTDLIRNDDNILQELQEMDSMNEFLTTNTSLWNQASPMKYFRNFRKLRIPTNCCMIASREELNVKLVSVIEFRNKYLEF